jgi:predicted phosphodiesterase
VRLLITAAALLLASAGHSAEPTVPITPQPATSEFHFVVLGDSQFDDPSTFNRMVDDVTHLNPAFVIQVGDMIDGYSDPGTVESEWQRFRHQIAPLDTIPFVAVPGNHDLYNAERRSDSAIQALYERQWGPTYRSFNYRNARFVILNSDAPGEERSIGAEQWRWLERTLAATDTEHVFVFLHRPPLGLANADALHQLLRRYPVRYVFYGHQHHYHYFERDGIRYVMTNAAAETGVPMPAVGGFDHLLLVSVRDADVRYAVVKADAIQAPDSADPADNQALFDLSRNLLPGQLPLEPAGERRWTMRVPLKNPTDRALTAYLSCRSDDNRWRFEPAAIPVVELSPQTTHTVSLTATYAVDGMPESQPRCTVQVPFQTRYGEWLPFEVETMATSPVTDNHP